MTTDVFDHQPWQMSRPCRQCGHQGDGYLDTRNGQDVVYCGNCGKYAGYNAPKTETGRTVRPHGTRPGIPPSKRSRILERDNFTCVLCGRRAPTVPLDIGHLISEVEGRGQGLTDLELYDDENLAAMCAECNSGQSDRPLPLRFCVAVLRARLTNRTGGDT